MRAAKLVAVVLLFMIGMNVIRIENATFIPISIDSSSTAKKLIAVGAKETDELVQTIDFASRKYGISQEFIIALTSTESNFDENAVSSKGYKGLMQVTVKVPLDANILIGVRIFTEKLRISRGDIVKAICLYKGYKIGSKDGLRQAKKVIELKERIING